MQRFPVLESLSRAGSMLFTARASLFRALLIPAVFLAALEVAQERLAWNSPAVSALLLIAYFAIYTVFAVSCHRVLLLDPSALPNQHGLYFTQRELRFLGYSLVIALIALPVFFVAGLPIALITLLLSESFFESRFVDFVLLPATALPAWYVMSRASLVLPATAIDQPLTLSRAWSLSAGNGWRVALVLGVPTVLLWIASALIEAVLPESGSLIRSIAVALAFSLLGAGEVAVLSATFQSLKASRGGEAAA